MMCAMPVCMCIALAHLRYRQSFSISMRGNLSSALARPSCAGENIGGASSASACCLPVQDGTIASGRRERGTPIASWRRLASPVGQPLQEQRDKADCLITKALCGPDIQIVIFWATRLALNP